MIRTGKCRPEIKNDMVFFELEDSAFKTTLAWNAISVSFINWFLPNSANFILLKNQLLPHISQNLMFYLFLPFHLQLIIILLKSCGYYVNFRHWHFVFQNFRIFNKSGYFLTRQNVRILSKWPVCAGGSQITFASLGRWVIQNLEKLQTL